jgi:prephenate dehydrogenase
LAATSHLPHMLAFGLVDYLARMQDNDEIFRYAAGGFRDFTRIASSNPVMWRDICIANADALSGMLGRFGEEMSDLAQTIRRRDGGPPAGDLQPRQGGARPLRRRPMQSTAAPESTRISDSWV